jgi:hypothetical protein
MRKIYYEDKSGAELHILKNTMLVTYDGHQGHEYELSAEDIEDLILDLIEMKKQFENE